MDCTQRDVCDRRFSDMERRIGVLEQDPWKQELMNAINGVREGVAELKGRVAGYLIAGGVLGAGVSMLLQYAMKR